MMPAPRMLHSVAQARLLDQRAVEQYGVSGFELMRRAGEAAARCVLERFPRAERIGILVGPGNNGGDGYVVATALARARRRVSVWALDARVPNAGDSGQAYQRWIASGGSVEPIPSELPEAELYVDALFGIGLTRALQGSAAAAVQALNASGRPVIALDVPSGLDADTGAALGPVVQAAVTVTFIVDKRGLHTGAGPAFAGRVLLEDLNLPGALLCSEAPMARRQSLDDLKRWLPRRARDAHKGRFGHVLVIGGDHGYAGAARLAAEAAGRGGAGLVSVFTRPAHLTALLCGRPELMVRGDDDPQQLLEQLQKADVLVVGPGLGRGRWSQQCLDLALCSGKAMVVDADALNLLADNPRSLSSGSIITPHPGEAARLLGISTEQVQQDRYAAALALAQAFGAVSVLKGAGSLIAAPSGETEVCPYGNPGLATGGSGDVLAGVCGALLAQQLQAFDAARAGVLAHALAGDRAAEQGERGMLAGDLLPLLRQVMNPA